ncbi:MAG: hypothetical protein Q9213_007766 [Squamulea squamosa]
MSVYRGAPLSTGHDYREPPRFLRHLYDALHNVFGHYMPWLLANVRRSNGDFTFKQLPNGAAPHRMALVADPQLVDPHTYPGRPWPLSTITRHHTDYYMRKSFTIMQNSLDPKTVLFLGDLFDGGREWLPPGTSGSDPRWRNYGEDYWIKEYKRFGYIFFDEWLHRAKEGRHLDHRKIWAGLPGNHDLGLGNGIRIPVRRRFNAFFGDGNRIDMIGNHTFVSLDTVSLSAKGQQDPATGRQGVSDGEGSNHDIWSPVEEFLENAKSEKSRVIDRAVRMQNNKVENDLMFHEVLGIRESKAGKSVPTAPKFEGYIPSVLLTHVPLYRARDTACGSLRERSPPSTKPNQNGEYLEKDPGNAIKVEHGFQYQNVLTPEISKEVIDKIGDVEFVFSGDDHDYCEVVHRGYTSPSGGVREITVKAFSWAMGVSRPGFLLLSLWNPLDEADRAINQSNGDQLPDAAKQQYGTIQTHLCLLPNQLLIFVRYVILLVITLFAALIRAARASNKINNPINATYTNGDILPFATKSKSQTSPHRYDTSIASANQSLTNGLAVRSATGRTRAASPYSFPGTTTDDRTVKGYSAICLHDDPLDERWGRGRSHDEDDDHPKRKNAMASRLRRVEREFKRTILFVALPVGIWWIYLVGKF